MEAYGQTCPPNTNQVDCLHKTHCGHDWKQTQSTGLTEGFLPQQKEWWLPSPERPSPAQGVLAFFCLSERGNAGKRAGAKPLSW